MEENTFEPFVDVLYTVLNAESMFAEARRERDELKIKIENLEKRMETLEQNKEMPVMTRESLCAIKQNLDYLKGEGVTFRNMKSFWAQLNEKIEGKPRRRKKSRSKKLKQAYKEMSTRKPVSHPIKGDHASDCEKSQP